MCGVLSRVRERFIVAFDVVPGADDARRAGEDESADAVLAAGGEDVARAEDVRPEVLVGRAPDAGFGGDVKDDVAARDGVGDARGVRQVAASLLDAEVL